jgi:hypothetical protein
MMMKVGRNVEVCWVVEEGWWGGLVILFEYDLSG